MEALTEARQLSAVSTVGSGEVGALIDLLCALDHAQAAATLLAERVDRHQLAERRTGLTLESLLACQAPLPGPDRRRLLSSARRLRRLPHLARAVQHGLVPGTALTALTSEAARLDAHARDDLDAGFADQHLLGRLGPDELVDATRDAVDRLAPALRERDQRRPIEDRFLALQPRLDGSLTGYFELDPESGATVLEAIESAAPPPSSGPRDVTSHAHDTAAGGPAVPGSWGRRSRGRQRADGLVRLAEDHLAGVLPPLETAANSDADMAGGVAERMGTGTATGVGTGKAAGTAGAGTGVGSGAGPDQPAASTRAPAHGD
ncbi:MAG: hypothetical protein ACLFV0_05215, partial [Nitriliruptoraceae bacterium]